MQNLSEKTLQNTSVTTTITPDKENKYGSQQYGKKEIGKSLLLLANIVIGSLAISPLLERPVNWQAVVIGFAGGLTLYLSAMIIFRKSNLL